MSKLHQQHLSQHLIERGGAMGVRHERANGERAQKRDGSLWSPPPSYRYRVYSPAVYEDGARGAAGVCRSSSASTDHRTWACELRVETVIRCHIRPCAPDWFCNRNISVKR